jgi:hypothetical protein
MDRSSLDGVLTSDRMLAGRDTQHVIQDHLDRRRRGDLDGDLYANYAEDVILSQYVDDDEYEILQLTTADYIGYIRWEGTTGHRPEPHDGTDTFAVEDGRISAQTIHYGLAMR